MAGKREIIERPVEGWNVQRVTTHPGEMLREEFLKPMKLSVSQLAQRTRIPLGRLSDIVHERRSVTADTALRLSRFFGMSADFWLRLQLSHDLSKARLAFAPQIERDVQPLTAEERTAA